MGYVFTMRSGAYMVGSLVVGRLVDRVDNLFLLIAPVFVLLTITLAIVPLSRAFYSLGLLMSVTGLSMSVLDVVGTVAIFALQGSEHVGQWLQALHFSWAVGAVTAPILARPFLNANATESNIGILDPNSLDIKYTYWIIAGVSAAVTAILLYFTVNKPPSMLRT